MPTSLPGCCATCWRPPGCALAGWGNLTGRDPTAGRLDRIIVNATVARDEGFDAKARWQILDDLGGGFAPEAVQESLARLELGFVLQREQGRYTYRVPLFRRMLAEQDAGELLKRELAAKR